jgi:3-oxoacyl-[acyl-carrier-protein] synthase-1
MRRVGVTGVGIVSCIGHSKEEVLRALQGGISGLQFVPEMRELGFRIPVAGLVKELDTSRIGNKSLRTMSESARYAAIAASDAVRDAALSPDALKSTRVGLVVGAGAGAFNELARAEMFLLSQKKPSRLGALGAVKVMASALALNLAVWLGVKGRCYALSSACCTGTDCIGHGFELIRHGLLDICICGAAEERGWSLWGFEAAGFSNPVGTAAFGLEKSPTEVCRPYDRDRQGMVVSEGAGIIILESLEHAAARGVPVYAEVIAYGSANDGMDMFQPTGGGLKRCIEEALSLARSNGSGGIDYINSHGAGTRVGDPVEIRVIREVFGAASPLVSSTKPLSGHAQGAAGALEAIFTLLMLQHGFITPTVNLEHVAPECEGIRHVRTVVRFPLETAMTFNAGLGGTNACLIYKRLSQN